MLILHDPGTLAHKTVELLGAKLIPALESPERITAILEAVRASEKHEVQTITFSTESPSAAMFFEGLVATHDAGYIDHLSHAHDQWVKKGLIEEHENILPECFPFPNAAHKNGNLDPPKDIFAQPGFYSFDMSSGICADTYSSAISSAHLAFQGVQRLLHLLSSPASPTPRHSSLNPGPDQASSKLPTVLALCRPPGHHCDTRRAGGYCYLNNAVVAVEAFRRASSEIDSSGTVPLRITILDLDFHHGNGTQEAFYADRNVQYISIHGKDEYPYYTGSKTERGTTEYRLDGPCTNLNYPLPSGSLPIQYEETLSEAMREMQQFSPNCVIISLGFDTFHLDPLGSFTLEIDDYADIASHVCRRIENVMEQDRRVIPCLILLEGGYVIEHLGANMLSFLRGWEEGVEGR